MGGAQSVVKGSQFGTGLTGGRSPVGRPRWKELGAGSENCLETENAGRVDAGAFEIAVVLGEGIRQAGV